MWTTISLRLPLAPDPCDVREEIAREPNDALPIPSELRPLSQQRMSAAAIIARENAWTA